jgi:uncharacterized protein with von Willebrand factor type A (vWA) domain
MIYAFGGLPENLASFCALLRRDYGFRIGAGELLDAARALDIVELSNQQAVRSALRTILAGTRDDVVAFDEAFDRFFLPRSGMRGHDARSALERVPEAGAAGEGKATEPRRSTPAFEAEMEAAAAAGTGPMTPIEANEEEEGRAVARASYSPVSVERSETPEVPGVDDAWVAIARALVRRVQLGPARKWRPAPKGRRFDLRRTLRASLQTGGEPLAARWLARPHRQPRFIVLIDGSRSMSQYAGTALRLASALGRATSRVEVFTFSTALQRVTTDLQRAAIGRVHRLHPLAKAWGGGTKIGASLAEFLRRFGERLLTTNTVVIVASDGLDVGDPETLRSATRAITRRSAALVWLNPLLETPGYEPTALGMSIARPFVTTFSAVNDLEGFVRLSRTLRVRT